MAIKKKFNLSDFSNVVQKTWYFKEEFDKPISQIDINSAFKEYTESLEEQDRRLTEQTKKLEKQAEDLDVYRDELKKHEIQLNAQYDSIEFVKNLWIAVILALCIVIIGWARDTFWVYQEVKENYISETENTSEKIELFKKDFKNLEKSLNEDINNLKERIKFEVENEVNERLLKELLKERSK